MIRAGVDPAREALAARQAADETEKIRMHALENIARDGFPQVGGSTIDGLLADGLIRRTPGRVPYALTLPGVELLLEKRQGAADVAR